MNNVELFCKICGAKRNPGRRLCTSCNLQRLKMSSKNRPRYVYTVLCSACGHTFISFRKNKILCQDCYKLKQKLASENKCSNEYLYNNYGEGQHRIFAEKLLQRKLLYNEVIHHMDNNPKNNLVSNLIIITRSDHGKLHSFLDYQRTIIEKKKDNPIDYWNKHLIPLTEKWIQDNNIKIIRLIDIDYAAVE